MRTHRRLRTHVGCALLGLLDDNRELLLLDGPPKLAETSALFDMSLSSC